MKKINTGLVADPFKRQPFTTKSLDFLQESKAEEVEGLVKGLALIVFGTYDSSKAYVLDGCVYTNGDTLTAGTLFFNGKLYSVNAITSAVNGVKLDIIQTQASFDPLIFSDGSSNSVHDIFNLNATDSADTGDVDIDDLLYLDTLQTRMSVAENQVSINSSNISDNASEISDITQEVSTLSQFVNVVDQSAQSLATPKGTIVMWGGSDAPFDGDGKGLDGDICEGWQLCNGNNGTVDLQGRFVVCRNEAGGTFNNKGNTGGVETVTLTSAQSGNQEITIDASDLIIDAEDEHTHDSGTLNIIASGHHTHNYNQPSAPTKSFPFSDTIFGVQGSASGTTGLLEGDHIHESDEFAGNTGAGSSHTHTMSGSIPPIAGIDATASHENLPPYYTLAYMQKIV